MKRVFLAGLIFCGSISAADVVFTPKSRPIQSVFVVIHGCLQSAESMALGTGFNQIAEQHGALVMYPQVPENSHPLSCWGWYDPANQRPDSGQLHDLHASIQSTVKALNLNHPKIYLAGISSGAATAAGLAACFPQSFAGLAVHSGPSYGLAQNLTEAGKILRDGPGDAPNSGPCEPRNFNGSVLVIQGANDSVVNPANAARVIKDFMGETRATSITHKIDLPYSYSIADFGRTGVQNQKRARLILIQGLKHAWSGFPKNLRHEELLGPDKAFPTQLPFFSEAGPSATNLIWDYFNLK